MEAPAVPDARWLWDNEPCRAACPVHTDAGAYVAAIAGGHFAEAYKIARAPNPFASICGRVCAAPCEAACRRGTVDAPVAIRALKRFVTERFGVETFAATTHWHGAHGPVPEATLGSVGVVGGGPAGLSAAHDLRLAGFAVTVYEAGDQLGGMMVAGIPQYRLSRELIAREIGAVLELGVEARTAFAVGRDATMANLLEVHDAVFLAVGAGSGRDLNLPGHDQDGILRAVEFLLNVNSGFKVDLGRRVVVVGGGNVAFDAARTALRAASEGEVAGPANPTSGPAAQVAMATTLDVARMARRAGVDSVTVFALESPEEIPADPEEIAEAEAEGITIVYRRGPKAFRGNGTSVTGLETIAVASVFDDEHRFAPSFLPDTEEVLAADTIIVAVGQAADLEFLGEVRLDRAPHGGLEVDPVSMRTSHERIWAGGDVAKGPRNLIDAIADGQRAAASIRAVLTGSNADATGPSRLDAVRVEIRDRPAFRRLATGYDAIERVEVPMVANDRRIGFGEVEVGYDATEAQREAFRCLRCFDNIMLEPELCILCGLCVDVCPTDCITINRADHLGLGREDQSVLLLNEDDCIRCGLCVNRCPPQALSMVHAVEVVPARRSRDELSASAPARAGGGR